MNSIDIFDDIQDLEDTPTPSTLNNSSPISLAKFHEEYNDDHFNESELNSLAKRGFSYYNNSFGEIISIPSSANHLNCDNPELKKTALMEILSAKQKQIINAFQKNKLSKIELVNLTKTISQVRRSVGGLVMIFFIPFF